MSKFVSVDGIIEIKDENLTVDKLVDDFIKFVEDKNCYFGGGFKEVDSEGNEVK